MENKKTVKSVKGKKSAKPVKGKKSAKPVKGKTTGNKELAKIISKIETAKKDKVKSVVVFTTNKNSYKANNNSAGFGAEDLKPKLLEAYKYLLINTNVKTRAVNVWEKEIEWTVYL